jgi:hypothetical protein
MLKITPQTARYCGSGNSAQWYCSRLSHSSCPRFVQNKKWLLDNVEKSLENKGYYRCTHRCHPVADNVFLYVYLHDADPHLKADS